MSSASPVRVGLGDVGKRVSLRSRIAHRPGEPALTDTVGRLLSWRSGQVEVERRDGTVARLAKSDLVAGRVIGDAPPGRRPRRGGS